MNPAAVDKVREQIAAERARIRAKVQPEIDAHWKEVEERQALDTAERNAIVEVNRERRAQRQAMLEARESARTQEVSQMATTGTQIIESAVNGKQVAPYTKERQVGKKKAAATKQIEKTLAKASKKGPAALATATKDWVEKGAARAAERKTPKLVDVKTDAKGKVKPKTVASGDVELLAKNAAAAKKAGVKIVASSKVPGTFFVMVAGTRDRAISGRLPSEQAAHKAIHALGLTLAK